jgi:hypothetical protein
MTRAQIVQHVSAIALSFSISSPSRPFTRLLPRPSLTPAATFLLGRTCSRLARDSRCEEDPRPRYVENRSRDRGCDHSPSLRTLLPEATADLLRSRACFLPDTTRKMVARLETTLRGNRADGQSCRSRILGSRTLSKSPEVPYNNTQTLQWISTLQRVTNITL